MSGGVMIAAINMMTIKACLRYWESIAEVINPILPRKYATKQQIFQRMIERNPALKLLIDNLAIELNLTP